MKKHVTFFLVMSVCFITNAQQHSNDELYEEDSLSIFMDGFISTHRNERDIYIDNKRYEYYYTLQDQATGFSVIMCIALKNGKWTKPTPVSFSGYGNDLEPFVTPDGAWIYFSSDRPVSDGKKQGFDIWRAKRDGDKWGTPENLGAGINTTENEFYPSVNNKGDVYFTAERKEGIGTEDIYVARKTETGFAQPMPLDTGVNSKTYEFNAWVSPDDSLIIFTSYGRKDDMGRGDLYMAKKSKTGNWLPAVHLGGGINSRNLDYCPFVDNYGHFYFTSARFAQKPAFHIPFTSLEQWDAATLKPGNGNSDIYKVPYYYFRQIKRKAIGEEE